MPIKSTSQIRLEDIEKNTQEAPVKAIHLIAVYRSLYGPESRHAADYTEEVDQRLTALENTAKENLQEAQVTAFNEKRWEDAASLSRSLAALGIKVEATGMEPDIIFAEAKAALEEGNNLKAFLSAVRSHEQEKLSLSDLLPFLQRAVEQKQRRTAAYFLAAANDAISSGHLGSASPSIQPELREYAEGSDPVSDMVKGVATVLVDKGIRTEYGRAYADRVLGSAFFVDSSGLLITNYHVIASEVDPAYKGYSRMYVRMGDASSPRIRARAVGWDKAMDLALIKVEIKPEYVFSVVDRSVPRVGETVFAIGSPIGLEKTVTQGIVSALGRRFLPLGDVFQLDAAVHGGNSGGPVVDREGRLIGIVFAGMERFAGLNFAVPAERLAAALPTMINGGKADRPWLGLTLAETPGTPRAEIVYVAPFTPAWEQRLKEGSIIERINGEQITTAQGSLIPALQDKLFPNRPGELLVLELSDPETNKTSRHLIMTASRPEVPLAEAAARDSKERMAAPLYGLILTPASATSGFSTSSYIIKKVIRGSIADEAGLAEQDLVSIRNFNIQKDLNIALMDISVKKRRQGNLEAYMRLPTYLDVPDTL